jgi:DNA-binding SARP family transcriptional activator/TolB-like protein
MYALRLFGGFALDEGPAVLSGKAGQRHRIALLVLLALAQPRPLTRDKLLGHLWPERDTRRARNLLSQAVHALRKALGPEAILAAGDELRLNPRVVTSDAAEFVEALDAGDRERAVELYEGPLLDGVFLVDSNGFEQWLDGERSRLRAAYLQALADLADDALERGDPAGALIWLQRLAQEDPHDARVALRLMATLEAAGDPAGAIRQATAHAALLRSDFDAEPNPEVMALAERIRKAPAPAAANGGGPEPPSIPADEATFLSPVPDSSGTGGLRRSSAARRAGSGAPQRPDSHRPPSAARPRRPWARSAQLTGTLALLGFAGWSLADAFGTGPREIQRLAVLPLENLMGDPAQDYFVAGMHDALVAELSQIGALTVLSRQSVLRYRGSDKGLPLIARELGVDALVEGSVFRAGDSIRITVQLVRADPEEHLWAHSYPATFGEALGLQRQVARALALAVRASMAPEAQAGPENARSVDPAAQEAYLRGLYHLERQAMMVAEPTPEILAALSTAIRYLEEAVALDPDWSAAHGKLALAYHWLASRSRSTHAREFFPRAKAAALRALALDPTEAQAHASLGFVLYQHEWDWQGAETSIGRALALDPNSHHGIYADFLLAAGRHDEAILHFREALARNPLSELLKHRLANAYSCAGRYDEAVAELEELKARTGENPRPDQIAWLAHSLGRAHLRRGALAEAVAELERAVALSDSLSLAVMSLAEMYAHAGRLDDARALVARTAERSGGAMGFPAHVFAALGESDRAARMVVEAFEAASGAGGLTHFRCTETYRALAHDPRIREIVSRIGFPH